MQRRENVFGESSILQLMQTGGKTKMNICTFFFERENHLGLPTLLMSYFVKYSKGSILCVLALLCVNILFTLKEF